MGNLAWLTCERNRWVIAIHAQPGAKRTEIVGMHGDALKIRVQAPPVEGAANAALVKFLAQTLGVRQRDVSLLSGERSREKRFAIEGSDPSQITASLQQRLAA